MIPMCAAALGLGLLIEFINGRITASALARGNDPLWVLPIRAALSAGLLVLVYFTSKHFGLDASMPLICAALGASVGLVLFTGRLIRTKNNNREEGEEQDG